MNNTLNIPKTLSKEDVDVRKIPFMRRMYGEKDEFHLRTKFYDNLSEIRYAEKAIKHYRETKDRKKLAELKINKPTEIRFISRAKNVRSLVERLRSQQKKIEKLNISEKNKELRIERVDDKIRKIMARFNKTYFKERK